MKLNITITDLTPDEAFEVMEKLTGCGAPMAADQSTVIHAAPATVNTAPVMQAVAPVASIVSEATDSTGLKWDARIHAGSRETKSDGTWKRRRGIQDFEYDAVVAELRTPGDLPVTPTAPVMASPIAAPVAPAPPAPVAAPVPAAAPQPPARNFQGLMQHMSNLFAAKSVNQEYPATVIARINSGFGVTLNTMTDIANDPRFVDYAWQCLQVDGKAE